MRNNDELKTYKKLHSLFNEVILNKRERDFLRSVNYVVKREIKISVADCIALEPNPYFITIFPQNGETHVIISVLKNINYEKFSIIELLFNSGDEEQIFEFLNSHITISPTAFIIDNNTTNCFFTLFV